MTVIVIIIIIIIIIVYYPSPPDTPTARRITWDGQKTAPCLAVNETDQDDDKKTTSAFPN